MVDLSKSDVSSSGEDSPFKIEKDPSGWFIKYGERSWGPSQFLPEYFGNKEQLQEIYDALKLDSESLQKQFNKFLYMSRVSAGYSPQKTNVGIEHEIESPQKIRFRVIEENTPLTGWVTLDNPEKLRSSRNAKVIRNLLEQHDPEGYRLTLEHTIKSVQQELERMQSEKQPNAEWQAKVEEVDKQIADEAMKLANSPKLLHTILEDMAKYIVGEERESLLCFCLCVSCKSKKDYAFVIVSGDSSSGKSWLMEHVLNYLPKEWWKKVGRLSRTALDYLANQDFDLLWIQERRGGKEASESIRLSSVEDGGTEVWVTARNPETGQFETQIYTVPGRSIVTTTVHTDIDSQDLTRSWLLGVDESTEQTVKIHKYQAREACEPLEFKKKMGLAEDGKLIVVQEMLRSLDWDYCVIIPYAPQVTKFVSANLVRSRRDLKKMYRLIRVLTLLHQKMRPEFTVDDAKFLVSTPADLYMACVIAGESFSHTAMGLDDRERQVLDTLREDSPLTRREVAQHTKKSMSWAYERLQSLIDKGYVDVDESEKTHKFAFRENIVHNPSENAEDGIPVPELEKTVENFLDRIVLSVTVDRKLSSQNGNPSNSSFKDLYVDPITGDVKSPSTVKLRIIEKSPASEEIGFKVATEDEEQSKNGKKCFFTLDEVAGVADNKQKYQGRCSYCGKKTIITSTVETHAKKRFFVCGDCADIVQEGLRKGDRID